MQHAERAASSLIKDVLSAQAKGRERHEKFEKEQSTREEMREKRAEEMEYMDSGFPGKLSPNVSIHGASTDTCTSNHRYNTSYHCQCKHTSHFHRRKCS